MDRRFSSALGMGLAVWVAIAGLGLRHGLFPCASASLACWTSTARAHVLALLAPPAPVPQLDHAQLASLGQMQHDAMQMQRDATVMRDIPWHNGARVFAVSPQPPRMHMVTRTIVINDLRLPAPRTIKVVIPQPDTNGY
jgi:hypothetical protein